MKALLLLFSVLPIACLATPVDPAAPTPPSDDGGEDAETILIAPPPPPADAALLAPAPAPPPDAASNPNAPISVAPVDAGFDSPPVVDAAVIADASHVEASAPPDEGAPDGAPDGACAPGVTMGELAIDELMIESVSGSGDYGEWVEVANTAGCVLNLNGLHAEVPHGSGVATLDILSDVWLESGGLFLIADSENPAVNHNLPGLVFEWAGGPSDTLRNEGSTVTLTSNGALVDTVTYPNAKLKVGVSFEFPSACAPALRPTWTNWQLAESSWFPGFLGTPNAPNSDVRCP